MHSRIFIKFVLISIVIFFGINLILVLMNNPINRMDVIERWSLDKLKYDESVEAIILGDSSGGNAINDELFSNLVKFKTIKLSLTGGSSVYSTFNILNRAIKYFPKLKKVYIIQTYGVLSIPKDNFIDFGTKEITINSILFDDIKLFMNTKEIKINIQYYVFRLLGLPKYYSIDKNMGYIKQNKTRYFLQDNKVVEPVQKLYKEKFNQINNDALNTLSDIEKICNEYNLECNFQYGPMNYRVYSLFSEDKFSKEKEVFFNLPKLNFIDDILVLSDLQTGDNPDHVANKYYQEYSTKYFVDKYYKKELK